MMDFKPLQVVHTKTSMFKTHPGWGIFGACFVKISTHYTDKTQTLIDIIPQVSYTLLHGHQFVLYICMKAPFCNLRPHHQVVV